MSEPPRLFDVLCREDFIALRSTSFMQEEVEMCCPLILSMLEEGRLNGSEPIVNAVSHLLVSMKADAYLAVDPEVLQGIVSEALDNAGQNVELTDESIYEFERGDAICRLRLATADIFRAIRFGSISSPELEYTSPILPNPLFVDELCLLIPILLLRAPRLIPLDGIVRALVHVDNGAALLNATLANLPSARQRIIEQLINVIIDSCCAPDDGTVSDFDIPVSNLNFAEKCSVSALHCFLQLSDRLADEVRHTVTPVCIARFASESVGAAGTGLGGDLNTEKIIVRTQTLPALVCNASIRLGDVVEFLSDMVAIPESNWLWEYIGWGVHNHEPMVLVVGHSLQERSARLLQKLSEGLDPDTEAEDIVLGQRLLRVQCVLGGISNIRPEPRQANIIMQLLPLLASLDDACGTLAVAYVLITPGLVQACGEETCISCLQQLMVLPGAASALLLWVEVHARAAKADGGLLRRQARREWDRKRSSAQSEGAGVRRFDHDEWIGRIASRLRQQIKINTRIHTQSFQELLKLITSEVSKENTVFDKICEHITKKEVSPLVLESVTTLLSSGLLTARGVNMLAYVREAVMSCDGLPEIRDAVLSLTYYYVTEGVLTEAGGKPTTKLEKHMRLPYETDLKSMLSECIQRKLPVARVLIVFLTFHYQETVAKLSPRTSNSYDSRVSPFSNKFVSRLPILSVLRYLSENSKSLPGWLEIMRPMALSSFPELPTLLGERILYTVEKMEIDEDPKDKDSSSRGNDTDIIEEEVSQNVLNLEPEDIFGDPPTPRSLATILSSALDDPLSLHTVLDVLSRYDEDTLASLAPVTILSVLPQIVYNWDRDLLMSRSEDLSVWGVTPEEADVAYRFSWKERKWGDNDVAGIDSDHMTDSASYKAPIKETTWAGHGGIGVMLSFVRVWEAAWRVQHRSVAVTTVNALRGPRLTSSAMARIDAYSDEDLCEDPLRVLTCHRRCFYIPRVLRLILKIFDMYSQIYRYRLSLTPTRDGPTPPGDRPAPTVDSAAKGGVSMGTGGVHAGVTAEEVKRLALLQESAGLQLLLEIGVDGPCDKMTLSEVRRELCLFIHQSFCERPALIKLIHTQGYPLEILPTVVRGVPSVHVCSEFLTELILSPVLERQVFGVALTALLARKYPLPSTAKAARHAMAIIRDAAAPFAPPGLHAHTHPHAPTHIHPHTQPHVVSFSEAFSPVAVADAVAFVGSTVFAIPDICRGFPSLREEAVDVLVSLRDALSTLEKSSVGRIHQIQARSLLRDVHTCFMMTVEGLQDII
eukprot:Rmarinus@m.21048